MLADHRIGGVGLDEGCDRVEEGAQVAPGMGRQLASDEVERLDAVGALVDHRNARIAHELFDAVLADVAVAAEHLHAAVGVLEGEVGEQRLHHGRHQLAEVVGLLPRRGAVGLVRAVERARDPARQGAAALGLGTHAHEVAAHVGVHDDRIGRLVRGLGAGERTALQPLPGVGDGGLIGDLGDAEAWMPTPRRSSFIIENIADIPLWGAPTIQPLASSKLIWQVAEAFMPILCSSPDVTTPLRAPGRPSSVGSSLGTRNRLMPLIPFGASGRRASTRWMMFSLRSWSPRR